MGRAIVREPSVFLFDEPLSNLDAKLRVQMRLEIRALQQRLGVTSIYVTHDQVEAMTLGDRLMVLSGGYVEQFGSPIELYENPASLFVAGFIGSPAMNFLNCEIEAEDCVRLENGTVLSIKSATSETTNAVTLGIRPEHMELSDQGKLKIDVLLLEHLGAITLIHATLHGTKQAIVASLPGIHRIDAGTTLSFKVSAEATHLFDSEHGKRLN